MNEPTFISLFSGIGGFDLGFERAGLCCVAQVEKDTAAANVLSRHYPEVLKFEDVTNVGSRNLPSADVVCGGFPCQDVSVAGRRAGLAGERSGLWFEFHRVIGELRPRFVVIENVPGLLSSNRGRDFAVILQGLVEYGYSVVWRVLDAQYFGLAQRRKRLFIVASLGTGAAAEVLLESEGGKGHSAPRRETGKDIAATVTARARKGGFTDPVSDNVIAIGYGETGHGYWQPGIQTIRARGMDDANVVVFNWKAGVSCQQPVRSDGLSGTLSFTRTEAVLDHGFGVRRLTPTECERLQGFPHGWTAGQSDSARYRQLGNAVAVPVAEWIGRRIVECR